MNCYNILDATLEIIKYIVSNIKELYFIYTILIVPLFLKKKSKKKNVKHCNAKRLKK